MSDLYSFSDIELPTIQHTSLYCIKNRQPILQQTNILNVHYHFDTTIPATEYVAVFRKIDREKVQISILTTQEGPIPPLIFRIEGGPRYHLPNNVQYPYETTYPHVFLVTQNTMRDAVIPRKIVQTWKSRKVSKKMGYTVEAIQQLNPEYDYKFYDDLEARAFIETHFNDYVLLAYDILTSGTYRADLFRYCYLYKYGGIYIDTKTVPQQPIYTIISYNIPLVLIDELFPEGICTIFLATPPENPLYKDIIYYTVKNILQKNKGTDYWDMSGPRLFGKVLCKSLNLPLDTKNPARHIPISRRLFHFTMGKEYPMFICDRAKRPYFFKSYKDYYIEQSYQKSKTHYIYLWDNDLIFRKTHQSISRDELLTFSRTPLLLNSEASSCDEYQNAVLSHESDSKAFFDDLNILGI